MSDPSPPRVRTKEPFRRQAVMRFEMPEDTLPAEHRARVLWRLVETLDLSAFTTRAKAVELYADSFGIRPTNRGTDLNRVALRRDVECDLHALAHGELDRAGDERAAERHVQYGAIVRGSVDGKLRRNRDVVTSLAAIVGHSSPKYSSLYALRHETASRAAGDPP